MRRVYPHPYPQRDGDPLGVSLRALLEREQDGAIVIAYRQHDYRLREIGTALGVHPWTICRRLRRAKAAWQRKGLTPGFGREELLARMPAVLRHGDGCVKAPRGVRYQKLCVGRRAISDG